MAAFESVGNMLENGVAGYSEQISGALISNISPVIFTGVSLYFLLKGWMFLTGRAEGAISDTVITAFKVALISMVGLNTGNFVSWGMGFINGAESLLMDSLPATTASNGWQALDNMWGAIGDGVRAIWQMIGGLNWTDVGPALLLVLLLFCFFIACAFLTLAGLGVFIIAKLSLVVVMGFGPLFVCMLMFPVTRTWFDGWLKTCMTYIFTVVMMSAVISLVTNVFENRIESISNQLTSSLGEGAMADMMIAIFTFLIVCVGLATLIKTVPTMASGITGGIGVAGTGLGQMLKGIHQGSVNTSHNIIQGSKTALSGATATENAIGNAVWTGSHMASSSSVRSMRALNAAYTNLSHKPNPTPLILQNQGPAVLPLSPANKG